MNDTFRRVQVAADVYDRLTAPQREILNPLVEDIRNIQREISHVARNAELECIRCKGACCSDGIEHGMDSISFFYMMFFLTKNYRDKIFSVLQAKNKNNYCKFLQEDGCIIPDLARPHECKSYFCNKINGFEELMRRFGKPLRRGFFDLQLMLWALGKHLEEE